MENMCGQFELYYGFGYRGKFLITVYYKQTYTLIDFRYFITYYAYY